MKLVSYPIISKKIKSSFSLIVISDLHNKPYKKILNIIKEEKPDAILIVGDLVDRHRKTYNRVIPFLKSLVKIAPTYMSFGNHEVIFPIISRKEFCDTGVHVLDNNYESFHDILIGGNTPFTNDKWLKAFEEEKKFKILLNHHPEDFENYLSEKNLDLILSGHAHGGQIRVFGKGLFAPGQGLFPKYTHGKYGHMIVTSGLANTAAPFIPRIGNPTEIVKINLYPRN